MGSGMSRFSQEEIEIYEKITCLDGAEIGDVYEKFLEMGGTRIGKGGKEQRINKRTGHRTAKNLVAPPGRGSMSASVASIATTAQASQARPPRPSPKRHGKRRRELAQSPAHRELAARRSHRLLAARQLGGTVLLDDSGGTKVKWDAVASLPEFAQNPFAVRLCEVFSSDGATDPPPPLKCAVAHDGRIWRRLGQSEL